MPSEALSVPVHWNHAPIISFFFNERESIMTRIVGIAGSLRAGSFNAALLRAAAALVPGGSSLEIGTISGIPLYNGDIEAAEGIPLPKGRLSRIRFRPGMDC